MLTGKIEEKKIGKMKEDSSIFKSLTKEEYQVLNSFLMIVDPVLKLNAKQKVNTIKTIRKLFYSLTSERSKKKVDYLNEPANMSAYIYYYLWWNLYRLVTLLNALPIDLEDGKKIGDFGCGPLTFLIALWISKPHLRDKELTFYCVDISSKAIKIGEELFYSLIDFVSSQLSKDEDKKDVFLTKNGKSKIAWKIKKITGEFGLPLNEKIDLFVSCNMFNELCWNEKESDIAKRGAIINSYLKEDAKVLVVEPGLPIGGKIVSSFRSNFLKRGFSLLSPCPHNCVCPIHEKNEKGICMANKKWCHFVFSTARAPSNLLDLSEKVHLAKKTVALSYIYCTKERYKTEELKSGMNKEGKITCIITSDIILLPNDRIGRYACSSLGFFLIWEKKKENSILRNKKSGSYVRIDSSKIERNRRDKKSGAICVEI